MKLRSLPLLFSFLFLINSCNSFEEEKIHCDCENISNGKFLSTGNCKRLADLAFDNATTRSSRYAHSGSYSCCISNKNPYGLTYKIYNAVAGERFILNVWRYKSRSNGCLVAACENIDDFYLTQHKSSGVKDGNWEEIKLDFIVPESANTKTILVYVYTTDENPVYFDDLTIQCTEKKVPPVFKAQSVFTDPRDGAQYSTVKIGTNWWMSENLNYPQNDSLFCYEHKLKLGKKWGKLYTYTEACKVCPPGWALPSDVDWENMEAELGIRKAELDSFGQRGYDQAIKMREQGSSGFNCQFSGAFGEGFYNLNRGAYFWSGTEMDSSHAICREINNRADVGRYKDLKKMKFSVRCIKKSLLN